MLRLVPVLTLGVSICALVCLAGGRWCKHRVFSIFMLFVLGLFQTTSKHDGEDALGPSARETVVCRVWWKEEEVMGAWQSWEL